VEREGEDCKYPRSKHIFILRVKPATSSGQRL